MRCERCFNALLTCGFGMQMVDGEAGVIHACSITVCYFVLWYKVDSAVVTFSVGGEKFV